MKKIKQFLCFAFFACILLTILSTKSEAKYYDYTIESYDIEIDVNEDNTFEIEETIEVYFHEKKHGIFRTLPLVNKIVREDGTKSTNRAKIDNIKVKKDDFSVYNENGNKVIKIGDEDETITGYKTYKISYVYNIGKDPIKDGDELYYNLIGTEWDTTIDNVTFTINMPKKFDEDELGFSTGKKMTSGNYGVDYYVEGKTITGTYNKTLQPGEGITIRLDLPESYFEGESSNFDFIMILAVIAPIVFSIIAFILWHKYGKDRPIVETVEFYPPEGLNSADVGFLYKGKANTTDVVSLIIYLANKGYLKIVEKSTKANDFELVRLKPYDGNNKNEETFLNGLFKEKSTVTVKDLRNKFYTTTNTILKDLNKKENKEKIFDKQSIKANAYLWLMIAILSVLAVFKPCYEYYGVVGAIIATIFNFASFSALVGIAAEGKKKATEIITFVFTSLFLISFILPITLPAIFLDKWYVLIYLENILGLIVIGIFNKIIYKRTEYGATMLGKIKGFRRFLQTAEKERLEALVLENPSYFYNILPYTYALAISDKWIKKFENINLQEPDWYQGVNTFNTITFTRTISSTFNKISNAMTSSPSSSGGSSGGGFSGGGSGGGGGGSW